MGKENNNTGRKTILNKTLIEKICGDIKAGMSNKKACQLSRISEGVYYKWIQKAELAKKKTKHSSNDKLLIEFVESIEKALLDFEKFHAMNIQKHSKDKWQASAFMLERKFPDDWSRKDKMEHSGAIDSGLTITQDNEKRIAKELGHIFNDKKKKDGEK